MSEPMDEALAANAEALVWDHVGTRVSARVVDLAEDFLWEPIRDLVWDSILERLRTQVRR
jgi:hypothetical protein